MPDIEIPEIRGIAPPLPPDTSWPLYVWLLIALLALASITVGILILIKLRKSSAHHAIGYNPRESALDKLHALKESYVELPATEFALLASHGLREYLAAFYGSATPFETGHEFLDRQEQQKLMNDPKFAAVRDLYSRAEELKYAPSPGADGQRLDLVNDMISFVRDDVPGLQLKPVTEPSDADPLPA
ncbi:MAG: hypothetical protein ACI9UA_000811 [Pseudoalteromonas tetraodonis]|jgi:hypothetical protein